MTSLISVILPVYNEELCFIKRSISSILAQTYKEIELIIVNDNPDRQLNKEIIMEFKCNDSRIIYLENKKNIGLTASLNAALKVAKGDYIARMDADDYSYPDRLEKQLEYLLSNQADLVGCNVQFVREKKALARANYPYRNNHINEALKYKCCVTHPAWLFKKEILSTIHGYRDFIACEDYDFLIRCALNRYKIANDPEVLLDITLCDSGISLTKSSKQELTAQYLRDQYKKNKMADFDDYLEYLSSAEKKLNRMERYCRIKNSQVQAKNNKLKYIILSFELLSVPDIFIQNLFNAVSFRLIVRKEK